MINLKETGRKRMWPNFNVISQHLPRGAEENHENLSLDSRSPVRDSKQGPLE
jgi:hypothetical protein